MELLQPSTDVCRLYHQSFSTEVLSVFFCSSLAKQMLRNGKTLLFTTDIPPQFRSIHVPGSDGLVVPWYFVLEVCCTDHRYGPPLEDDGVDTWALLQISGLKQLLQIRRQTNPEFWSNKDEFNFNLEQNNAVRHKLCNSYLDGAIVAAVRFRPDFIVELVEGDIISGDNTETKESWP